MPSREYRDPSGIQWDVFEVHRLTDRRDAVRPALASGWLAFVSAGEKRRLPKYPADWMQCSDDELLELLREAFLAPEPIRPVETVGGEAPAVVPGESFRAIDRRKRPRITLDSSSAPLRPVLSPDVRPATTATTSTTATTTTFGAPVGGALPVPPASTVAGGLGAAGIDALVRDHARQARRSGTAVIQGMIAVKRALADTGEDVSPDVLKQLRKVFVNEFYFNALSTKPIDG